MPFMPRGIGASDPLRNAAFNALPDSDRDLILAVSTLIAFEPGQLLVSSDDPLGAVYFPLAGVISIVIELAEGDAIHTAIVGSDGIAGIPPFVDLKNIGIRLIGEIRGEALAVNRADLYQLIERSPALSQFLLRYSGFMIGSLSMTIACTRFHQAHQQYARWLLDYHDKARLDCFQMTQSLLAGTLGVRRATITSVARKFRGDGIIEDRRGEICIRDRPRLEAMACECYGALRDSYHEIFGSSR